MGEQSCNTVSRYEKNPERFGRKGPVIRTGFATVGAGMFQIQLSPEKSMDMVFSFFEMGLFLGKSQGWENHPLHIDRDALYPEEFLSGLLPNDLVEVLRRNGLVDVHGFCSGEQILDIFHNISHEKWSQSPIDATGQGLFLPKKDEINDILAKTEPLKGIGGTPMLSVKELAKALRCHQNHIYRLVQRGEIPFHRLGRSIFFDLLEVKERTKNGYCNKKRESLVRSILRERNKKATPHKTSTLHKNKKGSKKSSGGNRGHEGAGSSRAVSDFTRQLRAKGLL